MTRKSAETTLLCVVCSVNVAPVPRKLCDECWDWQEVRSYCARCHQRTAQGPLRAQKLFRKLGYELADCKLEPGMVVHFLHYCPKCHEPHEAWRFPVRIVSDDAEEDQPPDAPTPAGTSE